MKHKLLWAIFLLYLAILLRITVFRTSFLSDGLWNGTLNLIPFQDLFALISTNGFGYFLYLFLGNIVWFIPFGFLLGALLKKTRYWPVLWGFCLSFLIEFLQFLGSSGVSETDDLVLNTLGTFIGVFLIRRIQKFFCL